MAPPPPLPPPPPPPQWAIDLDGPAPTRTRHSASIPDPPGFSSSSSSSLSSKRPSKNTSRATTTFTTTTSEETDTLKIKKSWEVALAPAKQLPMNGIMMYMSGNSLQIFSIMMVAMLFTGPLRGLLATNSAFARFETDGTRARLWGCKAVYVLMQLAALALGVWKVNGMGLLPTTRSDWLAWETLRVPLERAVLAVA
ncbi:MAG: hypothetical protein M1825_001447 [Sarcosagium campestre]|nr:MAG: hypothetical protein M1825_001447 [Sarcosagium campestre]